MKYLVVAHCYNEPDNNTPNEQMWVKVVECEPKDVALYEKVFTDEFSEDYKYGVDIMFEPLENFEDEWFKVSDIW